MFRLLSHQTRQKTRKPPRACASFMQIQGLNLEMSMLSWVSPRWNVGGKNTTFFHISQHLVTEKGNFSMNSLAFCILCGFSRYKWHFPNVYRADGFQPCSPFHGAKSQKKSHERSFWGHLGLHVSDC